MNKKFKFLTVLLALVMVLTTVVPAKAGADLGDKTSKDPNAVTSTVTLHKLMMTEAELNNWTQVGEEKYDGTQNLDEFAQNLGKTLTEVPNVYFALKLEKGQTAARLKADGSGEYETFTLTEDMYVKAVKTQAELKADPNNYDKTLTPLTVNIGDPAVSYVVVTGDVEEAVGGLTKGDGIKFFTEQLKGVFLIDEITEKTTYTNDGSVITDSKAVPVKITLPLVNSEGTVLDAHVYPKNTENKPQIDKNFLKENDLSEIEANETGTKAGAEYANYKKKKALASAQIGKIVPYEIKTEIPAKAKYKTAVWDDKMTEGLTFNKTTDLNIADKDKLIAKVIYQRADGSLDTDNAVTLEKDKDYTLTETDNGFVLELLEGTAAQGAERATGLYLINEQEKPVTVMITYSATLNEKAVVDIPESNDVMFHYGNDSSFGNTPIPTKPNNETGNLTVTKSFPGVTGDWVEGEEVIVTLYNAQTGEKIGDTITLTKDNPSHTWKNLDKDTEYKVVETFKPGYKATYGVDGNGNITIKNEKSNNPEPLNPEGPKVETFGKKFVKTNDKEGTDQKRLAGAEFYVKNQAGNYLALKSGQTVAAEVTAYETAQNNYLALVNAYNSAVLEAEKNDTTVVFPWTNGADTYNTLEELKAKLEELRVARDTAFKASRTNYVWVADKADALVLTSDIEGRFEITGLDKGTYLLEEKTPPTGFAKIEDQIFEVGPGTYTAGEIHYNKADETVTEGGTEKPKDAQRVINKKVTIPQTGGIGTIIFTVVGILLMGGAAIALKKRKEDELEGLA